MELKKESGKVGKVRKALWPVRNLLLKKKLKIISGFDNVLCL